MELLTYTNSAGVIFEFGYTEPYILDNFDGAGGLDFDVQSSKAPYQDGETYLDILADKRDIAISLIILAENQDGLYERRRYLSEVFNPKLGAGTLKYENDYLEKSIEVYLDSAPKFPVKNREPGYQICNLDFIAVNPFWHDSVDTVSTLAAVVPLLEFPLEIVAAGIELGSHQNGIAVIDNAGDVECPLKFEFAGPVTNPKIENTTTGEYIELIYPLLEGETMVITTGFGEKRAYIIDEYGVETSAFQYLNLASIFFQLIPGENVLQFTASAGSESAIIRVTYKMRYVGV